MKQNKGKDKWQKGKVRLSALELEIELDKNQRFRNYGCIENLSERADLSPSIKIHMSDPRYLATCFSYLGYENNKKLQFVGIHYKNGLSTFYRYLSQAEELFVRAHEEAHAAVLLGKIDVLSSELKKYCINYTLNPSLLQKDKVEQDIVGDIFGALALLKKGYSFAKVEEVGQKIRPYSFFIFSPLLSPISRNFRKYFREYIKNKEAEEK